MRTYTFTDVVEHRGKTFVVKAARGRSRHSVSVRCGGLSRDFQIAGRFGAELRNRAIEAYCGLETK